LSEFCGTATSAEVFALGCFYHASEKRPLLFLL